MNSIPVNSRSGSGAGLPPRSSEALAEDEQEKLVLSHMEDAKQVARSVLRSLRASLQLDDLIQAGSIGLIDAAKRFRPGRNLPFRQRPHPHHRGDL